MCIWSGVSLGAIYGTQIAQGEFNLTVSLFGIPFVLGTLLFGSVAVMSVCGRLVVTTDVDEGTVFTGIGPIGYTRHFRWPSITAVEEVHANNHSDYNNSAISLIGQTRLKFGSMLSDKRRYYLLRFLQKYLAERKR